MTPAGWIAAGLVALLLWAAPAALFLLFGGVLLGVMLDTLSRLLARVLPGDLPRPVALGLVCVTLLGLTVWGVAAGGVGFLREIDDFARTLVKQTQELEARLVRAGLDPSALVTEGGGKPQEEGTATLVGLLLPDPQVLYQHATSAFGALFGALGNVIVLVFVGIFLAADFKGYRRMLVHLAPRPSRPRAMRAVNAGVESLRWWLIGQAVTMAVVAVSVWAALALLEVPGAFLLGVQAGLINFIPYIGPLIALPPILLSALPQGMAVMLWATGAFLVIQTLEGYVLAPLIQRRTVELPPAVTIGGLVVFGALFGGAGVAVATPLLALVYAVAADLQRRPGRESAPRAEPAPDPGR